MVLVGCLVIGDNSMDKIKYKIQKKQEERQFLQIENKSDDRLLLQVTHDGNLYKLLIVEAQDSREIKLPTYLTGEIEVSEVEYHDYSK